VIETPNLLLIPCELPHFEALLKDHNELAKVLRVTLTDDWLGFPDAEETMQPSYEYLKSHPSVLGWWTYLFIHTADHTLIGVGGFKGEPNAEGIVEIGYAIAPAYRGRGLATEAASGMLKYAFSHPEVSRVDAHTLPERNPSTRVLERVGMRYVGVVNDPEDGEVWHGRVRREEYSGS
jgi:RimJ/RimL family protein N-acetyltransferase